jgi:hypothetical protein
MGEYPSVYIHGKTCSYGVANANGFSLRRYSKNVVVMRLVFMLLCGMVF